MKKTLIVASVCFFALFVLFMGIDPNKVPSLVLVLPFLLIFAALFMTVSFLLQKRGLTRAKGIKIAALCAALPVLLLVLQSIGQLTVRDVLTVAILFTLSYFYISRATPSS